MLLAPAAMRLLVSQITAMDENGAFHATLDARLFVFGLAVALGVSLLFSLAPAIQLLRPNLVTALKQKAATATGGVLGLRRVVVSLQVGLSVLLLVGAGLFVRTIETFDMRMRALTRRIWSRFASVPCWLVTRRHRHPPWKRE